MGRVSRIAIWAALFLLLASSACALEIKLKEKAVVSGRMVTLGEVAELSQTSAAERELAGLELFQAPDPGEQKVLRAEQVARSFQQRAFGVENVRWSGAASVTLQGDGVTIGPDRIEAILNDYLRRKKAQLPQAEVRFKSLARIRPFVIPRGRLSHEVFPSDPQILRSRRFTIVFRVDGKVVQNIAVSGELEAIAPVVVAANDLGRGLVLSAQDLNLVEMDLVRLKNPCFSVEELLGQRVSRPMRLGTPVDRTTVDFPPMIKRDEAVTIRLRRGGLQLTARGEARQNGKEGEVIRVRNSSSRKEILCRVIAPGLAEVEF